LTGCSTKPVYDEGLILELYPSRFEDGLYIHAFFQFSPPRSTGWERVELQNPRWVMLRKTLIPHSDENTFQAARLSVESWVDEPPKTQDTTEILAYLARQHQAYYKKKEGTNLKEFRAYPDSTCPITPCYRYDWLVRGTRKNEAGKEIAYVLDGHSYLFAHPEMLDLRKRDPGFPFFRVVEVTYSQVYPLGSKKQSIEDDVAHVMNSLRLRNGKQIY
jgi:hypothetical protein